MAVTVYRPRQQRQRTIGYNRRFLHGDPSSPFATPVMLNGPLDTTISTTQIKELVDHGYLHSTIVGFNQDYLTYSKEVRITSIGKQYRQQGEVDLQQAMQNLRTIADQMTPIVWGTEMAPGMSPSTTKNGIPTLDHLVRAQYALTGSPSAIVSNKWIQAYETWQQAAGQYLDKIQKNITLDQTLRRTLLVPAAVGVKQAAQAMLEHIRIFDKQIPKDQIPIDSAKNNIAEELKYVQNFDPLKDGLGSMSKKLVALASYFGTRSETLRTTDITMQMLNINDPRDIVDNLQQGRFQLRRIHINGLSDIVFDFSTDVSASSDTKLPSVGVSYKLRTFDNFKLSATFDLPADADADLKYLFYVYRNILALTEFASDKMIGRTAGNRRVFVSNRAKKNNLLLTLGSVRTALIDFNTYITYRLLLTAFFGNSIDANANPLDQTFFEQLAQGYENTSTAPPAFIMTARHIYKTADILEHYLTLDKKRSEWRNLNELQSYFAGYHEYKNLQKLWEQKRTILRNASADNADQNVYTILLTHIHELGIPKSNLSVSKLSFYREHTIKL